MKPLILTLILACWAAPGQAQDWAFDGFDAVGSRHSGHPVPGRSDIATMWKGELWHFASEENRSRFESDPRSFAPAFGGLCPVALANGRRLPGNPRHFVVIGDRLYLLRSDRSAQELRRMPQEILTRAGAAWGR